MSRDQVKKLLLWTVIAACSVFIFANPDAIPATINGVAALFGQFAEQVIASLKGMF